MAVASAASEGWLPTNTEIEEQAGSVSALSCNPAISSHPGRLISMTEAASPSASRAVLSASATLWARLLDIGTRIPIPNTAVTGRPYVTGYLLSDHPAFPSAVRICSVRELLSNDGGNAKTATLCRVPDASALQGFIASEIAFICPLVRCLAASLSSSRTRAKSVSFAFRVASAARSSASAADSFARAVSASFTAIRSFAKCSLAPENMNELIVATATIIAPKISARLDSKNQKSAVEGVAVNIKTLTVLGVLVILFAWVPAIVLVTRNVIRSWQKWK